MTNKKFFTGLGICSLLMGCANILMCRIPSISAWCGLGWLAFAAFLVFSVVMYFYTRAAAQSPNKNRFTTAVMGLTTMKLMMTAGLLFGWGLLAKPESALFVVPVMVAYAGFTVFELYFMLKLSRIPPPKESR